MTEDSDGTDAAQKAAKRAASLSAVEAQLCASAQSTLQAALDDIIDTRITSLWAGTRDKTAQIYMTAPDRCEEFSELLTKLGFDDIVATHITDFSYLEFPIDTPNNLKAATRLVECRYLADALEIAVDKGFGNTRKAYYRGVAQGINWKCRYTEQGLCAYFAGFSDPDAQPGAASESGMTPEDLETMQLVMAIPTEPLHPEIDYDPNDFHRRIMRRYLDLDRNKDILTKAGFSPERVTFDGIDALLVFPTAEHLALAEIVLADATNHSIANPPAQYTGTEGETPLLARHTIARTIIDTAVTAATMHGNQSPMDNELLMMAIRNDPARLLAAVMQLKEAIAEADSSSQSPTNPFIAIRDERRR